MFHQIYKLQFITKISRAYLTFSMTLKNMNFPLTVQNGTLTWGKIVLCGHLSFTAAYSLKSEKDWLVDFAKL